MEKGIIPVKAGQILEVKPNWLQEKEAEEEHKEAEPGTIEELKETMQLCNWSATDVGKYANSPDRTGSLGGWKIKEYADLKPEQIKELIAHIKENPK